MHKIQHVLLRMPNNCSATHGGRDKDLIILVLPALTVLLFNTIIAND